MTLTFVEKNRVFLSFVAVSLDCGRYTGVVQKKGDVVNIFAHFAHITYPSTPLIEGPASAPAGVSQKRDFFTISVWQRDKTTQIRVILLKLGWVDSMCMQDHIIVPLAFLHAKLKSWAWCLRMGQVLEFKLCVAC